MTSNYPTDYTYDDGNGNTCSVTIEENGDGYLVRCDERPGLTATGTTPEAALDQWASNHGDKVSQWGSPPSSHDPADAPGSYS